jgi:hypothetical protein
MAACTLKIMSENRRWTPGPDSHEIYVESKSNNDTPLTDELAQQICKDGVDWHYSATLMRNHARQLERELARIKSGPLPDQAKVMKQMAEALGQILIKNDERDIRHFKMCGRGKAAYEISVGDVLDAIEALDAYSKIK